MRDLNTWMPLIQMLAPIVGSGLTWLINRIMPSIPNKLLPVLATVIGTASAGISGADPSTALALGGSSVALREILNQNVFGKMKAPTTEK